jgi:hypothetical protein
MGLAFSFTICHLLLLEAPQITDGRTSLRVVLQQQNAVLQHQQMCGFAAPTQEKSVRPGVIATGPAISLAGTSNIPETPQNLVDKGLPDSEKKNTPLVLPPTPMDAPLAAVAPEQGNRELESVAKSSTYQRPTNENGSIGHTLVASAVESSDASVSKIVDTHTAQTVYRAQVPPSAAML